METLLEGGGVTEAVALPNATSDGYQVPKWGGARDFSAYQN